MAQKIAEVVQKKVGFKIENNRRELLSQWDTEKNVPLTVYGLTAV